LFTFSKRNCCNGGYKINWKNRADEFSNGIKREEAGFPKRFASYDEIGSEQLAVNSAV
jgi:hypothetical protein